MKKQLRKSEQITQSLSLTIDYDQPMTKMEEFESAFRNALGDIEVIKYGKEKIHPIKYTNNNHDTYFLTASITWLSRPHPLFKKRMQLKDWYQDFYDEYVNKENSDVRIVGVYRYNGMHIFVDFKIEDYIRNKCNNSSAHVYSNDLYQALKYDYFTKTDQKGNTITTIHSKNFKKYIDGDIKRNPIFELFDKFNDNFSFGEWITAITAIKEMESNNWNNWRQTEWAGWLLEYEMDKFIENEECQDTMMYLKNNSNNPLKLDLYFKSDDFYGDLKASTISEKKAPGNDQINTYKAINEKGKLWYIIYEHETQKDEDYNFEMAKARLKMDVKQKDLSHFANFKHSVNFKNMVILEINKINMHLILGDFAQGRNINKKPRKKKFNINKEVIDNFAIYTYPANIKKEKENKN